MWNTCNILQQNVASARGIASRQNNGPNTEQTVAQYLCNVCARGTASRQNNGPNTERTVAQCLCNVCARGTASRQNHLRVPRFGADKRPRPEGLTPVGKQPFSSFPLLLKTTFKTSSLYPLNSTCPAIPSSYPVSDYLKPPRISPTNYTALQHSHLPYLARFSRCSWHCPPAHCSCPPQRLSSSSSLSILPKLIFYIPTGDAAHCDQHHGAFNQHHQRRCLHLASHHHLPFATSRLTTFLLPA
jgi:hypothetical protein